MQKPEKILYTAHATSTGGREGTSKTDDGILAVKLTTPKGLGGNGAPGTNPEQLFAAGYSACFIGAMKFVAGQQKITLPADTSITADVGIAAGVPVVPAYFDYATRTLGIGPPFQLTSDMHADIARIQRWYAPFKGRNHDVVQPDQTTKDRQ